MLVPTEKEIIGQAVNSELLGGVMQKINISFFYNFGTALNSLRNFRSDTQYSEAANLLDWVANSVGALLNVNAFRLRASVPAGRDFLRVIEEHRDKAIDELSSSPVGMAELGWGATQIATAVNQFEPLFTAELAVADTYLVLSKGGFETPELVDNGICIFPKELPEKVIEAVADCNAAARCIAFELPTAAAFHLHRANEAVLKRYYDAVTGGADRPESRTVGGYLNLLEKKKVGDTKVIAALTSLKDLHRNPVLHPEDNISDVEEALALYGMVNSVMVHMLKEIPGP